MAGKIKVITKRPGQPPRSVWMANSLENFQTAVGGHIEAGTLAKDMAIICNEEGVINDLPYNCTICGVQFFGDIVLVGVKGDEFADLPLEYKDMKRLFPSLWEGEINHENSR